MSEIRDPICRIVRATRLLLVLLALLPRSAAAATIAISLASRADTIEIEGSAELNADPETAWRVLTDYERYVDFIPGLQESRVVARNGAIVTVEQTGDVELWKLHMPLDVTFEITGTARLSSWGCRFSLVLHTSRTIWLRQWMHIEHSMGSTITARNWRVTIPHCKIVRADGA